MSKYIRELLLTGALGALPACYSTDIKKPEDPEIRKLVDDIKGIADQIEAFYNLVPDEETKDAARSSWNF